MSNRTLLVPTALLCVASLAYALPAVADERVVREYAFDVSAIEEVEIRASVGSIRILPTAGDELSLVLDIEGKNSGWFRRAKDVDHVELDSDVRGDRLILEQTENNTNTEWTIRLPVVARTTLSMGVGEIDAELGATAVSIELGVGDVDLAVPRDSAGRVDLQVGVGEASLRGGRNVDTNRAFISQEVHGRGDGDQDVSVELGVGDISVSLY
jgi:hypothetical protein